MSDIKPEYFECACHSSEHRLVFMLDDGDPGTKWSGPPELYTETHLHDYRNIFQRIWTAIKYVFGYRCRYGCFDCYILKPEDTNRFRDLLDRYTEAHNTWIKELNERSKGGMDRLIEDSEDMGIYK